MAKFAMLFPGQGSQNKGMLAQLGANFSIVKETFDKASDVLNYDLWDLVQNDPENKLNQTTFTQPALLTSSVAIFNLIKQEYADLQIEIMAGHSLGEYSALVCAGALDFTDAVKLVALRGELMQNATPAGSGAMFAILGLEDQKIIEICKTVQAETNQVVSAVNFNCEGQVVIAGSKEACEKAAELCKENGAKRALALAVSVPSHCDLMKSAAEKLALYLENLQVNTPIIPVVNNFAVTVENESQAIKDALVKQLYSPVLWRQSVSKIAQLDISHLLEVGPGKVLTGLNARIAPQITSLAVNDLASLTNLTTIKG